MKRCTKCREDFPLESFPKDRSRKDGLANKCRACCLKQWQEWRAKNLERSQQYHRDYRAKNPEKVALWASTHARPTSEQSRAYTRRWREKNPERARALNRAWRAANQETLTARNTNWQKKYPERHAQRSARYKARKRENTVERVDYEAIVTRDNGICHICGDAVDLSLPKYHSLSKSFDHVIPLSRGGAHSMDNVKLSHLRCNFRKGAR